jgi:transaldolase
LKGTADQLLEQNQPVVHCFLQPMPLGVIDCLALKFGEFGRAYWLEGLSVDEYEHFGPVVLFRTSFEQARQHALQAVDERWKANA